MNIKLFKNAGKECKTSRIMKFKERKRPEILFTNEVLLKYRTIVNEVSTEIGWLSLVREVTPKEKYIVYDVIVPKQEVTGVTTELDEDDLTRIGCSMPQDKFEDVRCWCHSHVNMAVNPSGTDEQTFEQFYQHCPYFIRVICNKKNEMRVDFVDTEEEYRYDEIEWSVLNIGKFNELEKRMNELYEEYDRLVEVWDEKEKEIVNNFEGNLKKQIKDNVIEERKVYKTYKQSNNIKPLHRDDNVYSYYMPYYDSYEDYYSDYYEGTVKFGDTRMELEEIMDDEELIQLWNLGKETGIVPKEDLKRAYKNDERFKDYKEMDWEDLEYAVEMFIWTQEEDEEDEKETDYK